VTQRKGASKRLRTKSVGVPEMERFLCETPRVKEEDEGSDA